MVVRNNKIVRANKLSYWFSNHYFDTSSKAFNVAMWIYCVLGAIYIIPIFILQCIYCVCGMIDVFFISFHINDYVLVEFSKNILYLSANLIFIVIDYTRPFFYLVILLIMSIGLPCYLLSIMKVKDEVQ